MSATFRLDFNVSTPLAEAADDALYNVAEMVDERCIVLRRDRLRVTPLPGDVWHAALLFQAASAAEADDIARRVSALPGLPPVDAVRVRPRS